MANLYIRNDNLVQLLNLIDESTGALISAATVTAVLTDELGNVVTSISLAAMTAAGGYQGTLPAASIASLSAVRGYTLTVTAINGGMTGVWEIPVLATHRE